MSIVDVPKYVSVIQTHAHHFLFAGTSQGLLTLAMGLTYWILFMIIGKIQINPERDVWRPI